ncbi:MAG: gliding motility-associated C-terminal domain-containing protein [Bacteroidia bacterium]|nr:gliding motility-associated C-terminal domain-containing protein [Bacteroidia bacterium]
MKTFTENNFDELFKEKFSNFGENPPESVLQRIKNTASNLPQQVPFWKKGGFFAGIGGAILLIFGVVLINSFSTNNEKVVLKNTLVNNVITDNITPENNVNENVAIENVNVINNNNEVKTEVEQDFNSVKVENNEIVVNTDKIDNNISKNLTTEEKSTNKNTFTGNNNNNNNQQPNLNFIVNVSIKAATCRKANGKATLASNDQTVKFFWTEFDSNSAIDFKDNLFSGTYKVKAVNANGNEKLFTVNIPDSGVIRTRFTHYEMTQTIGVPVYFTNKTTVDGNNFEQVESIYFKWYFGDGNTSNEANPEYYYKSTGPFVVALVAYNSVGCKDSVCSFPINIAGSDIDFPNVFTPNGDGESDVFKPIAKGITSFHCVIYNRNGNQVYEFSDPEQGWDGKINHGLQMATPGTYYYTIKGVGVDGKIINHKQFLDVRY